MKANELYYNYMQKHVAPSKHIFEWQELIPKEYMQYYNSLYV